VLVPVKPFQSNLMFADKARSLPQSGVPEWCSNEIGSDFTRKH